MKEKKMRGVWMLGLVVAIIGCGGSDSATGPRASTPASVRVQSASVTDIANATADDRVTLTVRNEGGDGDYYLLFFGERITDQPTGCYVQPGQTSCPHPTQVQVAYSDPVNVTAGYSETLTYTVHSANVSSIHVMSRAVNTAAYTLSSCFDVRDYGDCPH